MKTTMIRITLEITDPDTAEAYRGKSPEIIAADLLHGSLMTACEVVSVEDGEPATPLHQLAKDWDRKASAFDGEALGNPKDSQRFFTMAGLLRAAAVDLRRALRNQKQSKP